MADISQTALKNALAKWSMTTRPMLGLAEYPDTAVERLYGTNPLLFTRQQEVVDQMLEYNKQLGYPLTEADMIDGINSFGKSQFDYYNSGYAVDSDPFNIGRWSFANALTAKGMGDAANKLIAATDSRQALTSKQAEEIGKKAVTQFNNLFSGYQSQSQQHNAGLGDILGAVATGLGVAALPFGVAGALGGLGELAAADGGSGLFGLELGGEGVGAGLGELAADAAGSGAMDWIDVLGDWPTGTDILSTGSQGSYPWLDAAGNLDVDKFLQATGQGGEYANLIPGGAEGIAGMDTLGSTSWLESAFNTLKESGLSPSDAGSALKSLLGGSGSGSLLGAGLGGLAGLFGGAKKSGTIDTTQTPWGPQQPFLLDAWNKAKAASDATNPIQSAATSNYQSALSGPTTNPMLGMDNPYLTKAIDNANADVTRAMMPAMMQANKASGSFGNSGVADIYGKNLTDAYSRNANDMRFKDYTNQQQLYQQAVGNTLNATSNASSFLNAPAKNYAQTVQGNYGGTTSQPYFENPLASALGGALTGFKLFGG